MPACHAVRAGTGAALGIMSGLPVKTPTSAACPAVRLFLLLVCGIIAWKLWQPVWPAWIPPALTLVAAIVQLRWEIASKRSAGATSLVRILAGYPLTVLMLGFTLAHFSAHPEPPPESRLAQIDDPVVVHGSIHYRRVNEQQHTHLELRVDSLLLPPSFAPDALFPASGAPEPDHTPWLRTFNTRAFTYNTEWKEQLRFAHTVKLKGRFRAIAPPSNPHQFNYRAFLAARGIHSRFEIESVKLSHPPRSPGQLLYWQYRARASLDRIFSPPQRPLARAILLGDRSGLNPQQQRDFSRAGLAHIMAVSGMHVGFLLFPLWLLLPWLTWFRGGNHTGYLLAIALLAGYAALTGFSVSVCRASVMAVLLIYAHLYQKPVQSINLLAVAGILLLLYDPEYLFEIGFQLSFSAVFIILYCLPVLGTIVPDGPRHTTRQHARYALGRIMLFMLVSLCVQAGLFPLLVLYFDEFSLIGPVANTLAIPFVQGLFVWSLLCAGLSLPFPAAAKLVNIPSDVMAGALLDWVEGAAGMSWSWLATSVQSPLLFPLWLVGILFLGTVLQPALRWKTGILFLLLLILYQGHLIRDQLQRPELQITFFDVGQGDAVLLETPRGYNVLYDAGIFTRFSNSARTVLIPELKARDIDRIDAMILSHPHADHIGGAADLIEHFHVGRIYESGLDHDSQTFRRYRQTALEHGVEVFPVAYGQHLDLDASMKWFVLAPNPGRTGHDPNSASVVLRVVYGHTSLLLTGDADRRAELQLLGTYGDFLQSDLLKVGHHGSNTSSTPAFLRHVAPSYAVTSVGLHNRYGHPHPEAMLRLAQNSPAEKLFTSLDRAVVFRSDGQRLHRMEW